VLSITQEQACAKSLGITVVYDPELQDRVIGDSRRLRLELLNLLGNAIKFTLHGEVKVTVKKVNSQICFAVMEPASASIVYRFLNCFRHLGRRTARPHTALAAPDWDSP